jgi:hypothetical protein
MYGLSKYHDGRPVAARQWWRMAGQSATELLQLNFLVAVVIIVCVAAGLALWHYSGQWLGGLVVARALLLGLINALLIWVALGALVTRRLAEAAIVINDIPLPLAIRLGLGMYWRVGGHMLAATAESLAVKTTMVALSASIIAAAIWIDPHIAVIWRPALYAGGVFLILLMMIAVSLQVEVRLWTAQYRHWAPLCYPDQRAKDLVTPRRPAAKSA